jgi:hypothetical protein
MNFVVCLAQSILVVPAITPASVLQLAQSIGDYAGYTRSPLRSMDYEITDRPGEPVYPGFISAQVMVNAHDVFDLSVRISDGRVFDFTGCYFFDYPFLRKGMASARLRMRDLKLTMEANGCVDFRILRRPGDEARR